MKKILPVAGVFLVSTIIFYISYLLSIVQGVADGTEVSYYFTQKGFPVAFLTIVEGKSAIDWKIAIADYLLILVCVVLLYFGIRKLLVILNLHFNNKVNLASILFWFLGVLFVFGGIYLLPATMWRTIAVTMLGIGSSMLLIGTGLLLVRKK